MAEPPDQAAPAPRIKLTRLHIEGYRSLRRVRWPEDGLGWDGAVPDTVLVGGSNGSGKSTLLEVIFDAVYFLIGGSMGVPPEHAGRLSPLQCRRLEIDLTVADEALTVRADPGATHPLLGTRWSVSSARSGEPLESYQLHPLWQRLASRFASPRSPRLVYFPTDRAVLFPATEFKGPGIRQRRGGGPIFRYVPPSDWLGSVEAILYDAKWSDLLALSKGEPSPGHFAAFEQVMQRFFAGEKQLFWGDDAALHVKMKDGALHPLEALSSGEKQVLLFAAELVDRWTPGSLVLIDEPELHLHEAWLATLWQLVTELQRERGGQVIVTTQSNYLWGLGGLGTHVLLGGWKP